MRETELDLDRLAQSESVFALANGHIGWRANLDEGEPNGLPGSYLGGFYETRPLPYAEAGYGYPEDGQTVVNVTNGKIIRLLVEDEPFDIRYGGLRSHERVLDLRAGLLRRSVEWESPTGQTVRVSSTRLVSFTQRAVAAILYEVEPLSEELPVVVQSELVANEVLPSSAGDPRAAAALAQPLVSEFFMCRGERALLVHSTRESGLRMAAAMDHVIEGPEGTSDEVEVFDDLARLTITADLAPGRPLRIVKFLAYGWSAERSMPADAGSGLSRPRRARPNGAGTGWSRSSVRTSTTSGTVRTSSSKGTPSFSRRSASPSVTSSRPGARGEQRAIAAKGLTGPGYDGHTFWDTESYRAAGAHLHRPARRRRRVCAGATGRSTWPASARKLLGLRGAAFPWRTIAGRSARVTGRPAPAAFHINADIADAVIRYRAATDDEAFEREVGLELLVETARLWRSLGSSRRRRALSHRWRDRTGRVQRGRRQQRLHEPDGAAKHDRGRRGG